MKVMDDHEIEAMNTKYLYVQMQDRNYVIPDIDAEI